MSALAQPAPQEIQRKLAVHTNTRKAPKGAPGHVSGTESDSDSIQTPDVLTPMSLGVAYHAANSTHPPLSSIAEREAASGEDSDEEDHADSGWKTPDNRTKPLRNTIEDTVLKSGYLWKKGERRKTWKKRWFVLRPAHLAYYKTSAEYQLLRLLDLSDIHSCTPVNLKRHDNTFGLISPNRTFYFQAGYPEEVREWVAAIEEARQTLLATSTQNSASTPIPIARSKEGEQAQAALRNLTISTSPGQLVTSSDSEDGGGYAEPRAPALQSTSLSAPSPTAVNFQLPPPPLLKSTTPAIASAPGSSAPGKVVIAGYLMKCGSKRRTWRKRWFVLTGEKLQYSGSHMDTKPHRVFPFAEILDALEYALPTRHHAAGHASSSAPLATTETDGEPANHTFKIVTTKRNLLLCAPTEDDEIKWLGAIRALIARRSGYGVVPGKTPKHAPVTAAVGLGVSGHTQEVSGSSQASVGPPPVAGGRSRTRRPSASGGSDGEIAQLKP